MRDQHHGKAVDSIQSLADLVRPPLIDGEEVRRTGTLAPQRDQLFDKNTSFVEACR